MLAKKSKNFDDFPVFGGLIWTILCLTLNIGAALLFIQGIGMNIEFDIVQYRWFFAFGLEGLLLFYYLYKGKYKKIIKYYQEKEKNSTSIHPIIVIMCYYIVSVGLIFFAGFFKNKIWIFANI